MNEKDKNLFLVLRHKRDPHQTYVNSWLDDQRIEAITTPAEIGMLCEKEKYVFIHRCGCGDSRPSICCSASVVQVNSIDQNSALVTFGKQEVLNSSPTFSPQPGQNYYFA
jgi:hypothetical protein